MTMMLVNNSVYIPKFDRGNMHIYLNKLQIWRFVTRVEKKMQGPLVWLSLPMDIKEASNDIVDDLCKDDGLDEVFKLLRTFQQENELEAASKQEEMVVDEEQQDEDVSILVDDEEIEVEQENLKLEEIEDEKKR